MEGLMWYFVLEYLDFRVGVYIARLGVYLASVLTRKQSMEIKASRAKTCSETKVEFLISILESAGA